MREWKGVGGDTWSHCDVKKGEGNELHVSHAFRTFSHILTTPYPYRTIKLSGRFWRYFLDQRNVYFTPDSLLVNLVIPLTSISKSRVWLEKSLICRSAFPLRSPASPPLCSSHPEFRHAAFARQLVDPDDICPPHPQPSTELLRSACWVISILISSKSCQLSQRQHFSLGHWKSLGIIETLLVN